MPRRSRARADGERHLRVQQLAQALTRDELHRDERQAIGIFHGDVHDAGVIKGGRGLGFPAEEPETIH